MSRGKMVISIWQFYGRQFKFAIIKVHKNWNNHFSAVGFTTEQTRKYKSLKMFLKNINHICAVYQTQKGEGNHCTFKASLLCQLHKTEGKGWQSSSAQVCLKYLLYITESIKFCLMNGTRFFSCINQKGEQCSPLARLPGTLPQNQGTAVKPYLHPANSPFSRL